MTDKVIDDTGSSARLAASGPLTAAETRRSVDEQIEDFGVRLEQFLRQAETSVQLGRELVEQRALNLDLQRQVHRLEEEVRALRIANSTGKPPAPAMGTLTDLSDPADQPPGGRDRSPLRALLARLR